MPDLAQQGPSHEELAQRSGLHINSIGLLEREQREPSLYTVFQLTIGLGISPAELVQSVAERNPAIRTNPGPSTDPPSGKARAKEHPLHQIEYAT